MRARTISALNIDCKDRDARGAILIQELIDWINEGTPFVYLRYGDGEFNSIHCKEGKNADKHHFFGETLGAELDSILAEIASIEDQSLIRVGGWWDERWESYVEPLKHRIPWCSAGIFYHEIKTLKALEFLKAARDYPGPKVLVGNVCTARVAEVLNAEHVVVPPLDCWLDYERTLNACLVRRREGTLFLYSCGMMANVLAWRLWDQATLQVNVGHLLNACTRSISRRAHLQKPSRTRYMLRKYYEPMFRI